MTNQSTIDKLIEMRLTAMADAFRNQQNDSKFKEIPFVDRFGMLVDIEFNSRKNNRLKRLIHNAGFDQPEASIMDINYTSGRKLNIHFWFVESEVLQRLFLLRFVKQEGNVCFLPFAHMSVDGFFSATDNKFLRRCCWHPSIVLPIDFPVCSGTE